MPEYKLHYFAIRGMGEMPRQVLTLAGVEFEDVRVSFEEWPAFKEKTPFGQMPLLEVDGKFIPQSFAIARFIASQHGLAGKTPFEAAWVDALADQWKDYHTDFTKYWYPKLGFGEGDLDALRAEHAVPARDKFFPLLEKQLKESDSGFLVGDSVTWVDLLIAEQVQLIASIETGFLDGFPEVLAHSDKVRALLQIAKWIKGGSRDQRSTSSAPIMPVYKLHSESACRGKGELLRQVLTLAGVEFEDVRVPCEELPALKEKTPFGDLPVLEVDGKFIPQPFAIAKYIASQHGLAGKTPLEAAWVDALADRCKEYYTTFKRYYFKKRIEEPKEGDADPSTWAGLPADIIRRIVERCEDSLRAVCRRWNALVVEHLDRNQLRLDMVAIRCNKHEMSIGTSIPSSRSLFYRKSLANFTVTRTVSGLAWSYRPGGSREIDLSLTYFQHQPHHTKELAATRGMRVGCVQIERLGNPQDAKKIEEILELWRIEALNLRCETFTGWKGDLLATVLQKYRIGKLWIELHKCPLKDPRATLLRFSSLLDTLNITQRFNFHPNLGSNYLFGLENHDWVTLIEEMLAKKLSRLDITNLEYYHISKKEEIEKLMRMIAANGPGKLLRTTFPSGVDLKDLPAVKGCTIKDQNLIGLRSVEIRNEAQSPTKRDC